jgi:hypothetical protein
MKALLTLNVIAVLIAVYVAFVQPVFTDLSVCMRYVELDRAGAINDAVLNDSALFHPSYGFGSGKNRGAVPRYIAEPALDHERINARLLLLLTAVNTVLALVTVMRRRTTVKVTAGDAGISRAATGR